MAGPNKKLVAAVEAYFADLRRVRASGGATGERSYYPALEGLLRAVGATLKPKVFCVQELAGSGGRPSRLCPLHGEAGSEGPSEAGAGARAWRRRGQGRW